ncbi:hypothetical protein RUM43_006156 [Polyplax serrata]|uniref:Rho GTPase-activating protein 26 n=1 Tax=Polyplax serrata TaxID=468196 RepID=A0AAN8S5A0_POLSC
MRLADHKPTSLCETADATLDMEERELCQASLRYVFLLQEVEERKKFEFVETLLSFLFSWLTFYHQGHDVYGEFKPYMTELQLKIQKTRENFNATRDKTKSLMQKVLEMRQQKPVDPTIVKSSFTREGYLFLMEKKAFGTTWTKQYCRYKKDTKEFEMIPFHQINTKTVNTAEKIKLASCTRRMSDSIEKRFCFDLMSTDKPGVVYTLQALSEADRKLWMDAMDGKEPTYAFPGNIPKSEERQLDEAGINFVKKCIDVIESRGLEEQGLYRIVGVNSKVNKLLSMVLDRRKADKLNLDDPYEWESKTLTSALKNFLRNLPEPLMTFKLHESFIEAAKKSTNTLRVNSVHSLVHKLPQSNFQILDILIKHLSNVASKSDKNLMSVSNLGVCFGPTLLRPEEETVAAILNIKFCNIVVEIMIENYEKIFKSQPEANVLTHMQNNVRELNHKFSQPQQQVFVPKSHTGGGGGSTQGSPSPTPHVRAPPRHQFIGQHNPSVIQSFYNDKSAAVTLSSSLGNVPSMTRERDFLPERTDQNSSVPEGNSMSTFYTGSVGNPVSCTVGNYSDSNLLSLNAHSNYDHLKPGRPRYQFSSAVTPEIHNSHSSSNESVSSKEGQDHYYSTDGLKKNHYSSDLYHETEYYNRTTYGKDGETYSSSVLYKSTGGGIPQKGLRNLGVHPLPIYRPQPDNVRVRTLFACLGENDGELSFDPNQIITNVRPSQEPGWLEGTLNGKTGLIPENYVEILP